MSNRPKNMSKFGSSKLMFTPNLGYKRIAAKDSDQQSAVEVKMEYDASSSAQTSSQKQKKIKGKSTTQVESVFSNLSSTSQGRSGSSRMGLSSGFQSYLKQGSFNTSGSIVKTEAEGFQTQSIQQMQLFGNNQLETDDPLDNIHGPVRLPLFKKDDNLQIDNSLEYPFQKNVYPMLSELLAPESLMTLQFYDSSFSYHPKIPDIELYENGNNHEETPVKTKFDKPIKVEYNGHDIKNENDSKDVHGLPIGKVQYYRSGRMVLVYNDKEYELIKANEDKHHKELLSLLKIEEAERPDKLVSLGTVPLRLKAVMDINCIIENFLKLNNN